MHDFSILAIIWLSVYAASFFAHKTRLTPVLWYLFFGALLVNLGWLPKEMPTFISRFAELGIILIMFALGFEEDAGEFLGSVKRSWGIAFFGALAPFCIAYSLALVLWQDANAAILVGLAMTATAVSLTMVSLKNEGLSKTPAATGIMTSAILDDIASLALVAVVIPIATTQGDISSASILLIAVKAVSFFVIVTLLGAWLFPAFSFPLNKLPFIGKFELKKLMAMGDGEYTVLSLLLIALLMGLLAHYFGFHPAIGAYMAGLIIRREYFNFQSNKASDIYLESKTIVENVAYSWIGPVFFVTLGSQLIFEGNTFFDVLPNAALLFLCLFVGQIVSAALAARYTGNFDWQSSWMIGIGMVGRAELAFVVINIAYVQYAIFSTETFYTLMLTIFFLNVSVPLAIRLYKPFFIKKTS